MHLEIRNWKKLQHYKSGRHNVWIKLYAKLLDDLRRGEITLREVTQAHLLKLWLVALRFDNKLPLEPEQLAFEIAAKEPIDFRALLEGNYLVPKGLTKAEAIARMSRSSNGLPASASTDASAQASTIASTNKTRREEIGGEIEDLSPSSPSAAFLARAARRGAGARR